MVEQTLFNPFAQSPETEVQLQAEETTKETVWLGDLIRDGFYDKIVLIGFPFDEGARKAGNRRGADFGPGNCSAKNRACSLTLSQIRLEDS